MADEETPQGGKTFGLDRRQMLVLGGAAAVGVLWFWWRGRSANQASTADTTSTADTGAGTDSTQGAVTPYPVGGLTEQQLDDLEAAIAALHGPSSSSGGTQPGNAGGGKKPPPKPPHKPPTGWERYTIKGGDTPAKISRMFGIPFATIWNYNLGSSSPHSAAAKAELRREGQNGLKRGQWLAIPRKK